MKELLYIVFSFLLLVFSFLPAYSREISYGVRANIFEPSYNMWGILNRNGAPISIDSFFLIWNMPFFSVLLPLLAATLFVARRLTQKLDLTVGSLSIDQFASVAAGVSVFSIFIKLITIINSPPASATLLAYTDSLQIGLIFVFITSIALCIVSIFALNIKPLSVEIFSRVETVAHPLARPTSFIVAHNSEDIVLEKQITTLVTTTAEKNITEEKVFAFWFAVEKTKIVVDIDSEKEIFTIQPGAWHLALEEHEGYFVVQNPNGNIGKLLDLHDIERA